MASQENGNGSTNPTPTTTLEMGTSEQVLVSSKGNKKIIYIVGAAAMFVVIAVVVTLVVVLTGNEAGESQPIVSTEGTTQAAFTTTVSTSTATTPIWTLPPTTTPAPTTPSPEPPGPGTGSIELDDIISGAFTTASFNATWARGTEGLFRNQDGDLILYDFDTDSSAVVVRNNSDILQQSSRVVELSPDGSSVVLSYGVLPVYRYSFLARYSAIDISSTNPDVDIIPPNVIPSEAFLQNFIWGPSGTACAFVYLNNIYYKSSLSADAQQITTTGQLHVIYHGIPDWVYEEEVFLSNNAMWFSRDGAKLAYATFDDTNVRVMRVPHYGVPGSLDYQYTQHREIRYPKPGTINPTVTVTLADVASGTTTVYTAPTTLVQPILKSVSFVSNTSIGIVWTNRVQNSLLIQVCEEGATCTQIFTYNEPNGWIDNIPFIFNSDGNAFITILPQEVNGESYKQIVQVTEQATVPWILSNRINTAYTVTEILKWTDDNVIWYKATTVEDSSEQHIYTVNANNVISCFSCPLSSSTGSSCLYNDASINPDGSRIAVNCAGPGVPQISIYNANNGQLVREWETNSEIANAVQQAYVPEIIRLQVPIAVGYPDADVHIQVPSDYEQRTNVPLLVNVYAGPDTAAVTKQWSIDWGTSLVNRWGIAVAHIDARGSGLRGVSNTFAVNRRLGTFEVDDQISVTRYLQQNLTWVDSNRTCIWGWSYGGYASSLALARGGDVFRCAIAIAPPTDWRFYDTIYTERYMDEPENNAEGYSASSLLTDDVVEGLRDKRYFLLHGTADDNVHYQHAMLLSRLLQRRDVLFSQMTYTDEDHSLVGVRPHLYHALEQFLQDNLL